ncbi:uncharacterized protein LOC110243865 isoform X1 [Exaiptasia diaphana]|uniref:SRCR domain-containing protein n=2 Tax=Exaiptasia diaphana TaxID=2652724 RepID=A0A913XK49_EXADI|nr:uncharacterized protein LOC110243865 isoform X1 [Exaiptasia diaphana]
MCCERSLKKYEVFDSIRPRSLSIIIVVIIHHVMYQLRRAVTSLLLLVIPCTAIKIRLNGPTLKYAGQIEAHIKGGWKKVSFALWDVKVARIVCKQLGYPGVEAAMNGNVFGISSINSNILISCHGNESKLDDCRRLNGSANGSAVLCTPKISFTWPEIIITSLCGLLLLASIVMVTITCCRITRSGRRRKYKYTNQITDVVENTTVVYRSECEGEPSAVSPSSSPSCSNETEEVTPDKHFVSVSVQTECTADDYVPMMSEFSCQSKDGVVLGIQKSKSSKRRRYMPLKRGSKYLVHLYTKLTKERNSHFMENATWNAAQHNRHSTASSKYQDIDSEEIIQICQRKSVGDDYQTIDSDDDFESVYFKVIDPCDHLEYVAILPDDDNHYLVPVDDTVPDTSNTYNAELPHPPLNIEGTDSEQAGPCYPPESIMNSQQHAYSYWINQLKLPPTLLQSVDERLEPNNHDVYDAIESDYNVPNQFTKNNALDKKTDSQPCRSTQRTGETNPDLMGSQSNNTENQSDKEQDEEKVKPTAFALALEQILKEKTDRTKVSKGIVEPHDEEHDYENIELQKDENDNIKPSHPADSSPYESLGDLKSCGYEDEVDFSVVRRIPILPPSCKLRMNREDHDD